MLMTLRLSVLTIAAVLCTLVAGFLVAFAVVVMPGIGRLTDREFVRAFQQMDLVIQNGHPLFLAMWLGSDIAIVGAAAISWLYLDAAGLAVLFAATAAYLVGVQLPTIAINIPMNNEIQKVDAAALDEPALREVRSRFEPRWTRWNAIRTVFACVSSALLIGLLAWH